MPLIGVLLAIAVWLASIMSAFEKSFGEALLIGLVCFVISCGASMFLTWPLVACSRWLDAWNRPDLTGLELPSSFPSDIPLPHAADISMTNRNKGGMGMWVMLTAKDRGDVVADFYRTELKRSGWTVNAFSDLKEWGELKGEHMVQLHVTNAKVQSTLFSSTDNLVAVQGKRILNLMIHGLKKPGEHGHLSMVSVSRFDGIQYRFK